MKKETQEWMRIAGEDLEAAKYLLERGLHRMVCYHAQQAVEKLLKAVLVEIQGEAPRTHNILDLVLAL